MGTDFEVHREQPALREPRQDQHQKAKGQGLFKFRRNVKDPKRLKSGPGFFGHRLSNREPNFRVCFQLKNQVAKKQPTTSEKHDGEHAKSGENT